MDYQRLKHYEAEFVEEQEPVVFYMRFSSDGQKENSIEYQRRNNLSYCIMKNYRVEKEYIDRAKTGTNDRREGFQKLLEDAKNHPEWKKIIVYKYNRIFRNETEAVQYRAFFRDLGIEIISVTQLFGNTPEGDLMGTITFAFDAYFSKVTAMHTKDGMLNMAEKGVMLGGSCPLGYDLDKDRRLIINEDEAQTVRRIFDMYLLNYPKQKMADILNAEGKKTKSGKDFCKNSFESILRQEKYKGNYCWNKSSSKDSKGRRNTHKLKPESDWVKIEGGCPVIVPAEQFDEVQKKLADGARGKAPSTRRSYMLTGLKILKCAECGAYMVGMARKNRDGSEYTVYFCPNHKAKKCPVKEIRTENVDRIVAKVLAKDFINRGDLEHISKALNSDTEQYINLVNRRRGIEKAKENLLKVLEVEFSTSAAKRISELDQEKSEVDAKIKAIEEENAENTPETLKKKAREFADFLMTSDDPDIKMFIKQNVKEILVNNDDVSFEFNID
ncbi:MAG: recombinase family protein [Oscillospiraceae bacterium]|nr:recombinase family protein [Oscillospiraceae bacterium]